MSLPQPHQTLPFRLHHPQQRPASFTEETNSRVDNHETLLTPLPARLGELRAAAHGLPAEMTQRSGANGSHASAAPATNGGETSRFKVQSTSSSDRESQTNETNDRRPLSAPGRKNGVTASDDIGLESERPSRPVKPSLHRSKSEYVPRQVEESDHEEDEVRDWGARHGFEDHYQSEHIISQLANVCFHELLPILYWWYDFSNVLLTSSARIGTCILQINDMKLLPNPRRCSTNSKIGAKETGSRQYLRPSPYV